MQVVFLPPGVKRGEWGGGIEKRRKERGGERGEKRKKERGERERERQG